MELTRALNDVEKPIKNSRIAILGVSYKGGVGDVRESPALRIMQELDKRGGLLCYHDPFVPTVPELELESVALDDLAEVDAIVLVTAHPGIDHEALARASRLFVDLRGVTRGMDAEHLVRL